MPITPTQTQDEFHIRSIDTVHINPSIMEGERFYPGILGPDAAVPIVRYAPTFLVQPSISGSFKIPSVLTCNPGVIDASPQALLYFQWKADGVDIPGETNATITTVLAFDAVELTCEVDAVNLLGVATGVSNGITAERVEPIINQQHEYYSVQGLTQEMQLNNMRYDHMVITGQAHDIRMDVEMAIHYVTTGMWVENRLDIEHHNYNILTGLGSENSGYLNTQDIGILTGLDAGGAITGFENDLYVVWYPTFVEDLPIVNADASDVGTTGWTVVNGTPTRITPGGTANLTPHVGTGFWYGGPNAYDTSMYQDVIIPPAHEANVDAEIMLAEAVWFQSSWNTVDQAVVNLVFLDAADQVVGQTGAAPFAAYSRYWQKVTSDLIKIPTLTRKIRVVLNWGYVGGNSSDGYIDSVELKLWKDG